MQEPEDSTAPKELPLRLRRIFLVLWCSFLAAGAATMVCFALLDPARLWACFSFGDATPTHLMFYTAGFFVFWAMGIAAAALTAFMLSPRV
jgi:hypothetical protein